MPSPLDQVTFDQTGGLVPIRIMIGDDLPSFNTLIGIPVTGYTFGGEVFDPMGNQLVTFTVVISQSTPTGVVNFSLTHDQCALIVPGSVYRCRWNNSGVIRTYVYGPFEVVGL